MYCPYWRGSSVHTCTCTLLPACVNYMHECAHNCGRMRVQIQGTLKGREPGEREASGVQDLDNLQVAGLGRGVQVKTTVSQDDGVCILHLHC